MSYSNLELFLPLLSEAQSDICKRWSLDPEVNAIASIMHVQSSDLVDKMATLLFEDLLKQIENHGNFDSSKKLEDLVHFSFNNNLKSFQLFKLVMSLQRYIVEAIFTQDKTPLSEAKEALFELNMLFDTKMANMLNIFSELQNALSDFEGQDDERMPASQPYQEIVDEVCAVAVTDTNGVITFVNDSFCTLSGYSKSELLNANVSIVKHLDTPKAHFKDIWNTITNRKVWTGELRNANKEGSAYYVSATIAPVIDHEGQIEEFVSVQYDITAFKEFERDFIQFYEEQENKRLSRLIDAQGSDLVTTIPLPAFIINYENVIVEFNDAFLELFSIEDDAELFKSLNSHTLEFTYLLDEKSQERFKGFTQEWVTLYNTLYCDDPLMVKCDVDFKTKRFELKLSEFKGVKTLICLVEV